MSPSSGNFTAFWRAVERGDLGTAERLIEEGQNVDALTHQDRRPIHLAVEAGHPAMVDLLSKRGATVNVATDAGLTPVDLAIENGDARMLRTLLERGADPEGHAKGWESIERRVSPLADAIARGQVECVRLLLDAGADPTIKAPYAVRPPTEARDEISALLRAARDERAHDDHG